jgi:hypothetical protein
MSRIWEINGLSLELDLDDADVMERYEDAFAVMAEEEKSIPKDGKQSVRIRAYCKLYHDLYDRIFGEGTSEKIFADVKTSVQAADEIYISFLTFVTAQRVQSAKERAEWRAKYMPNRKQRRTASKAVKKAVKKAVNESEK